MAQQRLIDNMRGVRYGEILAAYLRESGLEADVWGTQMLNDCPQELWATLSEEVLAKDLEAIFIKLNGPRYWVLDGLGTKVATAEPTLREFNGLLMRRIATIPLGGDKPRGPYTIQNVDRGSVFFWDAGKRVYELVDPEGRPFVMQALCIGVDSTINEESLLSLKEKLALPEGWDYRTRILEEELVVDTTDHLATVTQDEFENTYTLPY